MDKKITFSDIIKDHTVCWYPSAGSDFHSINLWNEKHGNVNNPTLFIFTDISYNELIPERIIHHNTNYWSYLSHYYPNGVVYPKINGLRKFSDFADCEDYMTRNEEFLLSIIKCSFSAKCDCWLKMSDDDISPFAEDLDITISKDTNGILCTNKTNHTSILLLQMYNKAFYNFCVANSISIPCLMVRRPCDNYIINKGLSIKKLKTTELCIREEDINHFNLPKKYRKSEQFIWSSGDTYDDGAHFITFS